MSFCGRLIYVPLLIFAVVPFTTTSAEGKYFWEGFGSALSSRAMSGAGLTDPLIENQVPWVSAKTADETWVVENTTLSSRIAEKQSRFDAISLKMESTGAFSSAEAFTPKYENLDALRTALSARIGVPNLSRVEYAARYFERGLTAGLSYSKKRLAQMTAAGNVDFRYHQDVTGVLGVSGPLFDKEALGRVEFGTTVKLIHRRGDEAIFSSGDTSISLKSEAFSKSAYAGGLDYSALYVLPKKWTGDYVVQCALTWKDMGETQFYLGSQTSKKARFESFPNNQSIGAGIGVPNIWRGTRAIFRIEYRQWFRDVSFWRKAVAAIEVRAPRVLTVYAGTRGTLWSAGAAFRFPHFELGIASAGTDYSEGSSLVNARNLLVELKGVF